METNLHLLSESETDRYYAVKLPKHINKAKLITSEHTGYLALIYNGGLTELGEMPQFTQILGVFGEIPERVAMEIINDSILTGHKTILEARLYFKGINLTKDKVAIIKTRK